MKEREVYESSPKKQILGVLELVKEKRREDAIRIALELSDRLCTDLALMHIVNSYAEDGFLTEAVTTLDLIGDDDRKALSMERVIQEIKSAYVRIESVDSSPDGEGVDRSESAFRIIEFAIDLASRFQERWPRAKLEKAVVLALLKYGEIERSVRLARGISHEEYKEEALLEIIEELCKRIMITLAMELTDLIVNPYRRDDALELLAKCCVRNARYNEALELALRIENVYMSDIPGVVESFLQAGQYEQASKLTHACPHRDKKLGCFIVTAKAYGKRGMFHEASQLLIEAFRFYVPTGHIQDKPCISESSFSNLASCFVEYGLYSELAGLIDEIGNGTLKEQCILCLVDIYCCNKNIGKALSLLPSIVDKERKDKAIGYITACYIGADDYDSAIDSALLIDNLSMRVDQLIEISSSLLKNDQKERAEAILMEAHNTAGLLHGDSKEVLGVISVRWSDLGNSEMARKAHIEWQEACNIFKISVIVADHACKTIIERMLESEEMKEWIPDEKESMLAFYAVENSLQQTTGDKIPSCTCLGVMSKAGFSNLETEPVSLEDIINSTAMLISVSHPKEARELHTRTVPSEVFHISIMLVSESEAAIFFERNKQDSQQYGSVVLPFPCAPMDFQQASTASIIERGSWNPSEQLIMLTRGICMSFMRRGLIGFDLYDMKYCLKGSGTFGAGRAVGKNAHYDALIQALLLLNPSEMQKCNGSFFNLEGCGNTSMEEFEDVLSMINSLSKSESNGIAVYSISTQPGERRVTILSTPDSSENW